MQGSMQIGRYKRFMQIANQILSTTGYETQCSTKGESYRFSPLETPSALCPPQEAGFTLNQIISTTGFEAPCSTKGKSYRFSPLWSNGPQLHGGNPIGFVPASRDGVYIELIIASPLDPQRAFTQTDHHWSRMSLRRRLPRYWTGCPRSFVAVFTTWRS